MWHSSLQSTTHQVPALTLHPPTSHTWRGKPTLGCFSLIFFSLLHSAWGQAAAESAVLPRDTIINVMRCVAWTNPAEKEAKELTDGERMVVSVGWRSKRERLALQTIYSATQCSAALGYFGRLTLFFMGLLWPLYISLSHYPLWLWAMFKVNFKESSVAQCCQGHFNRQDLGQGLISGEELCVWVQLPVWARDLSPCTSRVGMVWSYSTRTTDSVMDAALATDEKLFWLTLWRRCSEMNSLPDNIRSAAVSLHRGLGWSLRWRIFPCGDVSTSKVIKGFGFGRLWLSGFPTYIWCISTTMRVMMLGFLLHVSPQQDNQVQSNCPALTW